MPALAGCAVGVGYVIGIFNTMAVPWHATLRTVGLTALVGLVVGLVVARVVRRPGSATVVAVALIVLLALELIVPVTLAVVAWMVWIGTRPIARRAASEARTAAGISVFALAYLLAGLATALTSGAVTPGELVGAPPETAAPGSQRPSIYLILLDGYARADKLAGFYGYDNTPFLTELERRGFDVYHDAMSNYAETGLTLASMTSAAPLDELLPADVGDEPLETQYRLLRRALAGARMWDDLRAAGYEVVTAPPITEFVGLDGVKRIGVDGELGEFEIAVLSETAAGRLVLSAFPNWASEQHASRIRGALKALADVPSADAFVLAHLVAPHPPFVFEADRAIRPMPACFPDTCSFFGPFTQKTLDEHTRGYVPHLEALNAMVLEAIDSLPRGSIVVVWSDHGSRAQGANDLFHPLLAARTPHHRLLFGTAPTPTYWLPRLVNAYAGLDLPERQIGQWVATGFGLTGGLREWVP